MAKKQARKKSGSRIFTNKVRVIAVGISCLLLFFTLGLMYVSDRFLFNANASTTGGSGGSYTNQYNLTYTGGGFTSKYHLFAQGIDPTKPIGLVLNFHGDGAYGFNNPNSNYSLDADGTAGTVKVARDYNMITVSILTPDTATGDRTWWWRGADYADFVYALINNVYTKYNIDKRYIWFDGYSGGAQFITQYYISEYGGSGQFESGGALMFGGGDTPQSGDPQPGTVKPIPDSVKKSFRMWWGAGTRDLPDQYWNGGLDAAQKGEAYYRSIGFINTSHYYPEGWCHDTSGSCQSFEYQFAPYLRQQLALAYPNGLGSETPTPTTAITTAPTSAVPSPTTAVVTPLPSTIPTNTPVPDQTAPTVSLSASATTVTAGTAINFTASAYDNVGVSKVEFYQGNTKLTEDTISPYTYAWNTTNVAPGSYTFTARAYDIAGNVTTSSPVVITVQAAQGVSVTYSLVPNRRGVTFTIKVSQYAKKVLIRVSKTPLTGQVGNYDYNPTDANGNVTLRLRNELQSNTLYYYQIEVDNKVIESTKGTFRTTR